MFTALECNSSKLQDQLSSYIIFSLSSAINLMVPISFVNLSKRFKLKLILEDHYFLLPFLKLTLKEST